MNKIKFESLSSDSNEFVFFFILYRFKKFKIKVTSYIDIVSGQNVSPV